MRKYKNRRVIVDSRDPILVGGKDALDVYYTELFKETYSDVTEEVDVRIPASLVDELEITAFVDSNHAHDLLMRRLVTGLLILAGRTPVLFMNKRQGAIATRGFGLIPSIACAPK